MTALQYEIDTSFSYPASRTPLECSPEPLILCVTQLPRNQGQLSAWIRPLVKVHPTFGSAIGSLTRFFRERAAAADSLPLLPPKKAPTGASSFVEAQRRSHEQAQRPSEGPLGMSQASSVMPLRK